MKAVVGKTILGSDGKYYDMNNQATAELIDEFKTCLNLNYYY